MKDAATPGHRGPGLRWLASIPAGASRLAFRLPIYLYRLDLGRLLGHRFLLLVHRGRESGLLRETVLEVLLHDPATKESVVLSAWGEKADWYRNLEAAPALEVRTGGRRYVPEQRFLAPGENHAVPPRVRSAPPAGHPGLRQGVGLPAGRDGSRAPRGRTFLAPGGLPSQ